jgi:hypothetical protein
MASKPTDDSEFSFKLAKVDAGARKSIRDALKAALDAELRRERKSPTAEHLHSSSHSSTGKGQS